MIRTPSFIEGKVQSPLHKIRVKLGPGLASRGSDKFHVAKPLPPTQNPLLNSRSLQRFWQTTFSSHSTGCFAAIRTPPEHPWQKVYIKKSKIGISGVNRFFNCSAILIQRVFPDSHCGGPREHLLWMFQRRVLQRNPSSISTWVRHCYSWSPSGTLPLRGVVA